MRWVGRSVIKGNIFNFPYIAKFCNVKIVFQGKMNFSLKKAYLFVSLAAYFIRF